MHEIFVLNVTLFLILSPPSWCGTVDIFGMSCRTGLNCIINNILAYFYCPLSSNPPHQILHLSSSRYHLYQPFCLQFLLILFSIPLSRIRMYIPIALLDKQWSPGLNVSWSTWFSFPQHISVKRLH